MEKIFLACDHAAYEAKLFVKHLLSDYEVIDLGAYSTDSVNYPDYGKKIAKEVLENKAKGIALCGSGIGISIQVNRFKGIRGALCRDIEDAKMSRLHNNSNILCLGARQTSEKDMEEIVKTWLNTEFEGGRHQTRIDLLDQE
jgi:ribose 5-phosphate isomerase B